MASMTTARWLNRTRIAGCSTPSAALQAEAAAVGALHLGWRRAVKDADEHRARVEEAARESDYLRSSVDELEALSPVDGEEDELADRRALMMKAEKIAADINETSDILSGQAAPLPMLSSLLRRLEPQIRRSPRSPGRGH